MTGVRFQQLKNGSAPMDEIERAEFEKLLCWEKRSAASKRGVETKRARYKIWPGRRKGA